MVNEIRGAIRLHQCARQMDMLKKLPEGFVPNLFNNLWQYIKNSPWRNRRVIQLFQKKVCGNIALMNAQHAEQDSLELQQLYSSITGISGNFARLMIYLTNVSNQCYSFVVRLLRKINHR